MCLSQHFGWAITQYSWFDGNPEVIATVAGRLGELLQDHIQPNQFQNLSLIRSSHRGAQV